MGWDYQAVRLARADDLTELDRLGVKEWELVAVIMLADGTVMAYVKRHRGGRDG